MLDLVRQRRSVRVFKPQTIEIEKMKLLAEGLLRAPTSRNLQPCHFVMIQQRQLLDQLINAKPHGTTFFATAPLAVAIAADPGVSDVWIEDAAVAATFVQLLAEDLGLKSCWAQLRLRRHNNDLSASDYVRDLLELPVGMEVPIIIAMGYPDEKKAGHAASTLRTEKIHHERFSP
ncbi:nitroreductase family protein [Pelovirga terrestris]|uniref:Nitroreductase family protein n=1 Tax=Pelovirga terrestris TaxID=2771352 RepID=A0A8J6QLH8_9BACT|nr:nitroreductase family protein [Pelovirga terrestris]MBD1400549.1 nitroreductase family protein [Pelovirga terrestris]